MLLELDFSEMNVKGADQLKPYRFKRIQEDKSMNELTPIDESQVKLQVSHRVGQTESAFEANNAFNSAWKHMNRIAKQK